MRWKAHFFLNENAQSTQWKTYISKSKSYPNTSNELESFEKDLFNMVKKIEFKNVRDKIQRKHYSSLQKSTD